MIATPELDKIANLREQSQPLGSLLEWLRGEGWHLMRYQEVDVVSEVTGRTRKAEALIPDRRDVQQLLADYFEIDLAKADEERMGPAGRDRSRHANE